MSATKLYRGKVTELTPDQAKRFLTSCNDFEGNALNTERANRKYVEKWLLRCYKHWRLDRPQFFWADSFEHAATLFKAAHQDKDQIDGWFWNDGARFGMPFEALDKMYLQKVTQPLRAHVIKHPPQPGAVINLGDCPQPNFSQSSNREFVFPWFAAMTLKVKEFNLYTWIPWPVAGCGCLWVRKHFAVLMDRHEIIQLDERGRIHCENGPALRYPGGVEVFAIRGVFVPRKYIETPPDKIDVIEVLQEPNAAVRLALISKVGFERLLRNVHHWTISAANGNELVEFRIGTNQTNFLRALHLRWQDKVGSKETLIPVPRTIGSFGEDRPDNIDDCEQVRRWTLGWPKEAMAVAET